MCMVDRLVRRRLRAGAACGILLVAVATIVAVVLVSHPAQAIPSYARQTGQPCGACHTDFPQLTPFGRRFKLGGYTGAGGRTSEVYQKAFGSDGWIPPLSFMAVLGATRQDALGIAGSPFIQQQASFSEFYGGALTQNTGTPFDNVGIFQQATYNSGNGLHNFSWDNTDIRYADTGRIGNVDFIYGITANNNPTVQDAWNTVPAWSFPFMSSTVANGPVASTLIEGAFSQRVVGASAYTFISDMLYLELGAYRGVNPSVLDKVFGMDPLGQPGTIDRAAPYFRVAVEPHWGEHWLELGVFGMRTDVNPQGLSPDLFNNPFQIAAGVGPPPGASVNATDRFADLGFDAQYQYIGNQYKVTLRGTYIRENQLLNATFNSTTGPGPNGNGSDNLTNTLNSLKVNASLAYGEDSRFVFTGGYFRTWGSTDLTLYNNGGLTTGDVTGDPRTSGWIAEVAYIPFGMSRSPLWPYFNARIGLQYIWYDKFNGASINYDGFGTNARDNNTLFGYVWVAF